MNFFVNDLENFSGVHNYNVSQVLTQKNIQQVLLAHNLKVLPCIVHRASDMISVSQTLYCCKN